MSDTGLVNGLPNSLSRGYVRMIIKDFATYTRVGVHRWERQEPQQVIINVELFADDPRCPPQNGLGSIVDYDYIHDALTTWPQRPHTDLLETLIEELVALCFRDARVRACRVSVVKPDIFPEAKAAGVEIFRVRDLNG